ncbi:MAG: hypothetical protein WKF55_08225 [Gemmatimonadaceae bacterium]
MLEFLTDEVALAISHAILLLTLIYAFAKAFQIRFIRGWPGVVGRGENSMGMLAGGFATTLGVFALLLELSNHALEGRKSLVMLGDFGALLYLFFFNTWFRNQIVGRFSARHNES